MKVTNMLDSNERTQASAKNNVLFHVLLAVMFVFGMAGERAHAQYPFLLLDIGRGHTAAEIQEGFNAFTVNDSGTVVEGIKVEIEPMETGEPIQARWRGTPTGIPYQQLYLDFIFTVNGGLRITLSQLDPN
jgi:glutathione peroxidase-family protein